MRDPKRSKAELKVSEIIAIYTVRDRRGVKFQRGDKLDYLPQNTIFSDRNLRSIIYKRNKANPIKEAKRFKTFIDARKKPPYDYIAFTFGVSKARISQMLSLLKNLPPEIISFIENQSNPNFLCFFTERKLRELTKMSTNLEKINAFQELLDDFNKKHELSLNFSGVQ